MVAAERSKPWELPFTPSPTNFFSASGAIGAELFKAVFLISGHQCFYQGVASNIDNCKLPPLDSKLGKFVETNSTKPSVLYYQIYTNRNKLTKLGRCDN